MPDLWWSIVLATLATSSSLATVLAKKPKHRNGLFVNAAVLVLVVALCIMWAWYAVVTHQWGFLIFPVAAVMGVFYEIGRSARV